MKIIKPKIWRDRFCNECLSQNDVKEISFKLSSQAATSISLCKECREKLIKMLKENYKMKTIKLNTNEIRTLEALLLCNPCSSCCAYPQMQNSKKDCDECKLQEAIVSIQEKIEMI